LVAIINHIQIALKHPRAEIEQPKINYCNYLCMFTFHQVTIEEIPDKT